MKRTKSKRLILNPAILLMVSTYGLIMAMRSVVRRLLKSPRQQALLPSGKLNIDHLIAQERNPVQRRRWQRMRQRLLRQRQERAVLDPAVSLVVAVLSRKVQQIQVATTPRVGTLGHLELRSLLRRPEDRT